MLWILLKFTMQTLYERQEAFLLLGQRVIMNPSLLLQIKKHSFLITTLDQPVKRVSYKRAASVWLYCVWSLRPFTCEILITLWGINDFLKVESTTTKTVRVKVGSDKEVTLWTLSQKSLGLHSPLCRASTIPESTGELPPSSKTPPPPTWIIYTSTFRPEV